VEYFPDRARILAGFTLHSDSGAEGKLIRKKTLMVPRPGG